MKPRIPLAAGIPAVLVILAASACGSSPPAGGSATATAAAPATPSAAPCKLKTTFGYIERDDEPGAQVQAIEIGNVDFGDCAPALQDFASTAGQAPGECTTIAKASDNPGYPVNEIPAPPLKDVLAEAGPGCG